MTEQEQQDSFLSRISGKQALVGVAALVLIGGGSAAVIDYFATTSGTATVNNPAVDADSDSIELSGDAAPETFYNTLSATNNNDDRFVDVSPVTFGNDNLTGVENANRSVYKVQTVNLTSDQSETDDSDVAEYTVRVTPNVDEVRYRVYVEDSWFDRSQANADVEVSMTGDDSEENFHIKYSTDQHSGSGVGIQSSDNWAFFKPSISKDTVVVGKQQVLNRREVRNISASPGEDYFTISVRRKIGESQTFGAGVYQAHEYSSGSWNSATTDGFQYNDTSTKNQTEVDTTNYLGSTVELEPGATQDFNAGVFLDSSTAGGSVYNMSVGIEPVTAGN